MMDEKDKKFNGVLIKKSTKKDIKEIEKLIDEEERRKDEEMNAKIHSWNPNKGYWRN